jgi:transcription elongation factor
MSIAQWLEDRHLSHPLLAVGAAAAAGGLLWAGVPAWAFAAAMPAVWYHGREVTHAGNGRDPWYSGFNLANWSRDNHLDFWPVVGVSVAAGVVFALA